MSVSGRLNVNVALNRTSWMSTTFETRVAAFANDGDRSNMVSLRCAHHDLELNPWWAVDLGVKLHVTSIKFTNRGDQLGTY